MASQRRKHETAVARRLKFRDKMYRHARLSAPRQKYSVSHFKDVSAQRCKRSERRLCNESVAAFDHCAVNKSTVRIDETTKFEAQRKAITTSTHFMSVIMVGRSALFLSASS